MLANVPIEFGIDGRVAVRVGIDVDETDPLGGRDIVFPSSRGQSPRTRRTTSRLHTFARG